MASSPEVNGDFCYYMCPSNPYNCPLICIPLTPQFPYPPPFPPPTQSNYNQHIPRVVIIVVVLASVFLLVSICTVIIKHSSGRNSSRSAAVPSNNTHEDHDQINNPANRRGYVRTVGLDESVINSITVCKYRRGEGRHEGTECSICLNEFREDENLRVLPSCNHAFHVPCIDTWLKSHQNCPLCRSKVVSDRISSLPAGPRPPPDSGDDPQMGNSQRNIGLGINGRNGVIVNHSSAHGGEPQLRDLPPSSASNGFRSNINLAENNQSRECRIQVTDNGMRQVHRSVSMDSISNRMSSVTIANLLPIDSEGSSTSKGEKKCNSSELTGSKSIVPKNIRNQTIYKTTDSHSEGPLQEEPRFILKRSFSGGGEFLLTRY